MITSYRGVYSLVVLRDFESVLTLRNFLKILGILSWERMSRGAESEAYFLLFSFIFYIVTYC